jgi:CheY-like chemotaxis protein
MEIQQVSGRALVVDDEEQVRETVGAMLGVLGYQVEYARLPSQALERAGTPDASFELLVVDVILPEMTGLNLARLLVERWPQLKVIYTSGYASASVLSPGVAVEGASFLTKPFSTAELVAAASESTPLAA